MMKYHPRLIASPAAERSGNGYLYPSHALTAGCCYGGGIPLPRRIAGGLSVAYAIVHMLPTDLLLNVSSAHGLAMVFSLCCWPRSSGTWVLCSRLACIQLSHSDWRDYRYWFNNALMTGTSVVDALNIPKVLNIFASLIVSPIVGLIFAGGLVFLLRRFWSGSKKRARIHLTPAGVKARRQKKAAFLDAYRPDSFCYWREFLSRCERWSERYRSDHAGTDWRRTCWLRG